VRFVQRAVLFEVGEDEEYIRHPKFKPEDEEYIEEYIRHPKFEPVILSSSLRTSRRL